MHWIDFARKCEIHPVNRFSLDFSQAGIENRNISSEFYTLDSAESHSDRRIFCNAPSPSPCGWPDEDVVGVAQGGGINSIVLHGDPGIPIVGKTIDVWIAGPNGFTAELSRQIIAYDPENFTATVSPPWSDTFADGTFIAPAKGITYAIEVTELVELPRLGADGLLPWLDEMTAERQASLRESLKAAGMDKREQVDTEFSIRQNAKAVISDLNVPSQRPEGVRRILKIVSLRQNEVDARNTIGSLGASCPVRP